MRLAGRMPAPAHVLGEGGHGQLLRDLRLAHERAGAAPAHEVALPDELVQRRPHGQPRDAEIDAQLALRAGSPRRPEPLDQVEDALPGLALLGHPRLCAGLLVNTTGVRRRLRRPARSPSRLSPVCASKKWNRDGIDRERRCVPPHARATSSGRRARVKSDFASASSVVSSVRGLERLRRDHGARRRRRRRARRSRAPRARRRSTSIAAARPAQAQRPRRPPAGCRGRRARCARAPAAVAGRAAPGTARRRPRRRRSSPRRGSSPGEPMNAATKRSRGSS